MAAFGGFSMRRNSSATAASCGLVLSLMPILVKPASAQVAIPADLRNDQIEISYVAPRNPAFRPLYDRYKNRQVLEQLRAFMAPLSLTRKVTVKIDQCG